MSIADTLTGFASSLRARLDSINTSLAGKGQTAAGSLAEIPAKIDAIETGADVSGVTAAEGDVLSPKVFVDSSGESKTGTIITKSVSDLTTSGASVVVPAGYYPDEVSKSVATAIQATPSISVSSSGLITASTTQSAGYVSSGAKAATKQLSTKSATTYTPSTSNQTISSGYYLTGTQTIQGDSNLVASNIKSGTSIFGVTGNYLGGKINSAYNVTLTQASDYTMSLIIDTTNLLGVILFPDGSRPLTDTSIVAIATMFIDTIAKNGHFSNLFYTGGRWYIVHNEFYSGSVNVLLNGITFQPPVNLDGDGFEILGTDWMCIPIYKS